MRQQTQLDIDQQMTNIIEKAAFGLYHKYALKIVPQFRTKLFKIFIYISVKQLLIQNNKQIKNTKKKRTKHKKMINQN